MSLPTSLLSSVHQACLLVPARVHTLTTLIDSDIDANNKKWGASCCLTCMKHASLPQYLPTNALPPNLSVTLRENQDLNQDLTEVKATLLHYYLANFAPRRRHLFSLSIPESSLVSGLICPLPPAGAGAFFVERMGSMISPSGSLTPCL